MYVYVYAYAYAYLCALTRYSRHPPTMSTLPHLNV